MYDLNKDNIAKPSFKYTVAKKPHRINIRANYASPAQAFNTAEWCEDDQVRGDLK
jgi:hypothetical protein